MSRSEDTRVAYRTCPLCEATCGLEIHVRGDEVVKIRGDAEDVFSRGYVCPKGTALGALHSDPDRLRRPLVKRGGEHVEVSWEEAFAEVERRLPPIASEHGADAVAVYLGNPNVHNLAGSFYARPVLKALKTRNIYSASTVDQMPRHVSCGLVFGGAQTIPVPDLDRTDHLLMLGANPLESNGSLCTAPDFPGRLKALRERGGKLVVVDPRRTRTARIADEHLFVRPGTDALLLVAMIHTLLSEGLVETGALSGLLAGADRLEKAVEKFEPERVAERCGVPAPTIRRLARELADAPTAVVYGRMGTNTVAFGTVTSWATDVLNILTGNLDRPGGAMFPRAAHGRRSQQAGGRGFALGRWQSRARGHGEVNGELPVATLVDEIETAGEGQVRALLTIGGNPVLSTPDAGRLDRALSGLEFMVSVDIYCNETTRHADVILPPPSPLERSHYDAAFYGIAVRNVANYSPPLFEAQGPSESEILARLALIAGGRGASADPAELDDVLVGGLVAGQVANPASPIHGRDPAEILALLGDRPGPDRLLDAMLRLGPYGDGFEAESDGLSLAVLEANPHGVDLGPLEPRLPDVLSTPSARIELAPPPILADLQRLEAALDRTPSRALLLIGRRDVRSNNSWMHNVDALVRGRSRCTLQIHPEDAERLGLSDGQEARVASRVGEVSAPVEVTTDLMPGVVCLPHGWGHDAEGARLAVARRHAGVNTNVLTDGAELDPLSGNAVLNGIPVEVTSARA